MYITIDIATLQDARGKNSCYWPTCRWMLEDSDTVSVEQMNALANDLNKVLRGHLSGNKKLKIEVCEDKDGQG